MTTLLPEHLATFTESGIPADVASSIAYTEADPAKIAKLLNWSRPAVSLGPCIVIPFLHRDGSRNCFCRVRPSTPRISGGKPAKYEQPKGASLRAYFPPQALAAIDTPQQLLAITEGEKKSVAVCLAGIPCIGLTGVNAWQKPAAKGKAKEKTDGEAADDREMIEDLAGIDWKGRPVLLIFDTDPRRNPNVNHALAELARILELAGATAIIITLPTGPSSPDGMPGKMGADDFIVRHGAGEFRQLLELQRAAMIAPARKVEDYQQDVARERMESLKTPGVAFLDRSPPGAGKSTAAIVAKQQAGKSITVLATHKNCEEEEITLAERGMDAAAYPPLNEETCQKHSQAEQAMAHGLSVSGALCQSCEHKLSCVYWQGMNAAETAEHSIATHHRAALSMNSIAKGKRFIDIHEDPAGLLRPSISISANFDAVAQVAHDAKRDCLKTDWKMKDAPFFALMEEYAVWINDLLATVKESGTVEIPDSRTPPATADATLLRAMKNLDVWPDGDAVRIAKGLAAGEFCSVCIQVDPILIAGGKQDVRKKITAYRQTKFPPSAVVWLNDATANAAELAAICNLPVIDRTPGGRIEQRHPIVQIPIDLKKSTATNVFLRTLAIAIRRSNKQRIGIICDRRHTAAIKGTAKKGPILPAELRERIARVEHFRSGEGRGSNSWIGQCDLMIIAGTPRVPEAAIRARLLRAGNHAAAARTEEQAAWGPDWWPGRTLAGERRTVKTLAYRDRDWHQAQCDIVRAELLQCIGRGRAIRETGMPVIVITADCLATPENPAGFPLANSNPEIYFLTMAEEKIISAMKKNAAGVAETRQPVESELTGTFPKGESGPEEAELTGTFPYIYYLGNVPVSTSVIAELTKFDERNIRRNLVGLQKKNLVEKVGQRGGWKLTSEGVTVAGGEA